MRVKVENDKRLFLLSYYGSSDNCNILVMAPASQLNGCSLAALAVKLSHESHPHDAISGLRDSGRRPFPGVVYRGHQALC